MPIMARARPLLSAAAAACAALLLAPALFFAAVRAAFGTSIGAGYAGPAAVLCDLDRDGSSGIVVGGDSRAQYQIDPAALEARTGRTAVNAAAILPLGGDLPTLMNALALVPGALATGPVVVISVSMNAFNDNELDLVPMATVWNWNALDHARAAWARPRAYFRFLRGRYLPALRREALHRWRKDGFACTEAVRMPPARRAARGFVPYPVARWEAKEWADTLGWRIEGGNWRAFRRALRRLERSPARAIVLLEGPVAPGPDSPLRDPVWRAVHARFSRMLAEEAARGAKTRFVDCVERPPFPADTSLFYDRFHLNARGAAVFSAWLGEYLAGS
jgi:hypothetical protein